DACDRSGSELEMIAEKNHRLVRLGYRYLDAAKLVGTAPPDLVSRETNDLITDDVAAFGHRAFFENSVDRVGSWAGHEEDPLGGEIGIPAVVSVTAVDDDDRSRIEAQTTCDADVGTSPIADDRHGRQVAVVVEKKVQFHRSLGALVLSPIEQTSAELDHRRVQT